MKCIILFSMLVLFNSSIMAELVKIDDFVGDGRNVFADTDHINRSGDRVTMWLVTNYAGPREVANKEHLSTKALYEYDCKNDQYRPLTVYWFTEHDAEGEIFYEETAIGKMRPILADSEASEARKIACEIFNE